MKTKLLILIALLTAGLSFGQTTIYIDPTANDPLEDGTIAHPYNDWGDFAKVSGNTYLQKKGTKAITTSTIQLATRSNITIGAYGTGTKPIINKVGGGGDIIECRKSTNITIDGFELDGNGARIAVGVGGEYGATVFNENIQILNCDMHNLWSAVYGDDYDQAANGWRSSKDLLIQDCKIWDIYQDGIYIVGGENVTIIGCTIESVNLDWYNGGTAEGDGIQLIYGCTNWLIKDCIIDRRTTAGKMAVIVPLGDGRNPLNVGAFIGNTVYTPKDTVARFPGDQVGGTGLYITDNYRVTISHNKFLGRGYPIAEDLTKQRGQGCVYIIQTGTVDMYYNLFDSVACGGVVAGNDYVNFYNNTAISPAEQDTSWTPEGNYLIVPTLIEISGAEVATFRNNIAAGNTTAASVPITIVTSSNVISSNNLVEVGNPSGWNSAFGIADWEKVDYQLVLGSPAIDEGYDYIGYPFDLYGIQTVQNGKRDIGCAEFPQTVGGDPPVAGFRADDETSYLGQTINFIDESTNNPTQWLWSFNPSTVTYVGGTGNTSRNPSVIFTNPGVYDVTLLSTNSFGFDSEIKPDYILVYTVSVANFSANDVDPTVGQTVTFTDLSSGTPLTWNWTFTPNTITFVGGTNQTSQNPQVTFPQKGYYSVRLDITFAGGSDSEDKPNYINVIILPVADFTVSKTNPEINETVLFTDLTTENPVAWFWNIPSATYQNGTDGGSQNPQVKFTSSGDKTITLIATNAVGEDTEQKKNYIHVATVPLVDNVWFTNITAETFVMNWEPILGAEEYRIKVGFDEEDLFPYTDYSVGNVTSFQCVGATLATTYDITGVEARIGASWSPSYVLFSVTTVCYPPVIDSLATFIDESYTRGNTIYVGDSIFAFWYIHPQIYAPCGLQCNSYVSFESGLPSSASSYAFYQSPWIVYNNPGIYDISLAVTNNGGSDELIFNDRVIVLPTVVTPVANFQANKLLTGIGQTINFIDLSTNTPTSWAWTFGTGAVVPTGQDVVQNPSGIKWSSAGTKTIVLTATNAAGSDVETKTNYITVSSDIIYQLLKY